MQRDGSGGETARDYSLYGGSGHVSQGESSVKCHTKELGAGLTVRGVPVRVDCG